MKTLFTGETISRGGRSGTIKTPDGMPIVIYWGIRWRKAPRSAAGVRNCCSQARIPPATTAQRHFRQAGGGLTGGARTLLREHFCRRFDGEREQTTNNTNHMTTLEIKGDWNITKGKLKQKWAQLTDDDLQYAEGKQEEMLGRIQKRTGETREAVEKAVKESCSTCCS
jgi:uncharacterized protein YjbJ (UPF0337 family)